MNEGTHAIPRIPGRLRRSLFGYRRADVVAALEHLGWQLDGLAASVDRLYGEREELRARLADADAAQARALREQEDRFALVADERRAVDVARGDQHLAEARAQAARVLAEGEEQAARLRHEAGLRVGDAASRLEDLLHVREQLLGELRGLLVSYGDLLGEHEGRPPERAAQAESRREEEPAAAELPAVAASGGGLFPRHVELDAGPFGDFTELSAFERALARLPKVDDVYIRSFGDERATIELSLTEQTPLAHDLTTKLPYGLRLERGDDARLLVEVLPAAATSGD
ncbi:MAG TPA: hypothetical protein VML35_01775 [Gaiellaceae bacterium]|nr:hypothetical protein [Gaiellaceae bacterium]